VAEPDAADSVHVLVEGLQPGLAYHYRFEAGGQRSPVGRTRTAPAPQEAVGNLRMALASCQHLEHGHFTVHREIAAADLDLVLFVGDYIYCNQSPGHLRVRTHPHAFPKSPAEWTLADFRVHHASYKLDPDLRACHAAHPWLLVWDDQEVFSDYAGHSAPSVRDVQVFLRLRTAAYKAYFEHLPVSPRKVPMGSHMPMQGQYRWGRLADLWTLDTRQWRDGTPCDGPLHAPMRGKLLWRCDAAEAQARTVLGDRQEQWLAQGLASSDAQWKFVVQSTQMAPGLIRTPLEPLVYSEGWDAYPAARARLLEAVAQPRVQDVVFLGGDVHRHVAAGLRLDPADLQSPIVASEFVCTSVSSVGVSEVVNAWIKRGSPDVQHMRSDERGYALIDVTPLEVTCDFRGTPHPVGPKARLRTQARYRVERGQPGPRRV
jgi:alkaline phosphatase D